MIIDWLFHHCCEWSVTTDFSSLSSLAHLPMSIRSAFWTLLKVWCFASFSRNVILPICNMAASMLHTALTSCNHVKVTNKICQTRWQKKKISKICPSCVIGSILWHKITTRICIVSFRQGVYLYTSFNLDISILDNSYGLMCPSFTLTL